VVSVVYHPDYLTYCFGPEHPFSPVRLEMLWTLLEALGCAPTPIRPPEATRDELGIRVPEEVSVIGFDDIPMAAYLSTPLTSVRVPKREMGARAAELLLELIEAHDRGEQLSPRHIVLEAELVERATTRAL